MKDLFALVGALILGVALLVGALFLVFYHYQYFAPKYEDVRTEVYRNSKSYTEGTIRDLRELRLEYDRAEPAHKGAIQSLILQRSNELDHSKLPIDLQNFLGEL